MLTRARGGGLLDSVGEIYHLLDLCPGCHRASDGRSAYDGGLLIDGYVSYDNATGQIYYTGSDLYLSNTYPEPQR